MVKQLILSICTALFITSCASQQNTLPIDSRFVSQTSCPQLGNYKIQASGEFVNIHEVVGDGFIGQCVNKPICTVSVNSPCFLDGLYYDIITIKSDGLILIGLYE